jgi:O-antigen/teichoic acid export membrane protein
LVHDTLEPAPLTLAPTDAPSDPETVTSQGQVAARSLIWTALESFGLTGLSFLSLIVLSRILEPADFGAAAMALGVIQLLNLPVEMTFHDALVQRRAVTDTDFDTAFTVNVVMGTLLSGVCWLGADTFGAAVGEPKVAALLGPMSLSLPAMGFAASVIADQRRRMAFRPLALRSLFGRSGGALLAIAAALGGAGVWSLVVQQVASVVLAALTLWVLAARRPRLGVAKDALRGLVGFGIRTVAVTLVSFSAPRLFITGIGTLLGVTAAGYVALAFRCIDMLRDLFAGAILQIALPVFSRLQDDRARLERHFTAAVELATALMYPVFIGLALAAPDIIGLVFGAKWLTATPYFALVAVLTLQYITRMFSAPLMAAVGKPHYSLASGVAQLLILAAGLACFGRISLTAAMMVWALRLVITMPLDMLMLSRASGISPWQQIKGALPSVPLVLAMAAVVLGVQVLASDLPQLVRLLVMVASGVVSYLLLLITFRRALVQRVSGLVRVSLRSLRPQSTLLAGQVQAQ